jgi:hypothetical protein
MAIIADAISQKITWPQAAQQIGNWFKQIATRLISDPIASQAINQLQTDVKQGASNALALADGYMAAHYADAVTAVEGAVDGLMIKATGGAALPAVPLVNDGIKKGLDLLRSVIDAKELEWQAKLNPPAPPVTVATPPPQPQAGSSLGSAAG